MPPIYLGLFVAVFLPDFRETDPNYMLFSSILGIKNMCRSIVISMIVIVL